MSKIDIRVMKNMISFVDSKLLCPENGIDLKINNAGRMVVMEYTKKNTQSSVIVTIMVDSISIYYGSKLIYSRCVNLSSSDATDIRCSLNKVITNSLKRLKGSK